MKIERKRPILSLLQIYQRLKGTALVGEYELPEKMRNDPGVFYLSACHLEPVDLLYEGDEYEHLQRIEEREVLYILDNEHTIHDFVQAVTTSPIFPQEERDRLLAQYTLDLMGG